MANRHLARSIVLQTLFEWDVASRPDESPREILLRNAQEFAPGMGIKKDAIGEIGALEQRFMDSLLSNIIERKKDLDTIIEKAAPDWPLDKISPVDRNALRIGLYELLFADRNEVPPKVAINEAIELAKSFGGDASGKFVNGVLGSVYKEIGEPGKNDTPKKKKPLSPDEIPVETLGGAVVYANHEGMLYLALVHDVFGHWTLSKGHLEEGENVADEIIREIKEELGLPIEVEEELGTNEYVASHPEKGKIRKRVVYHLAKAPFQDLVLGATGGLDDARWFKLADIVNLNIYDDILPIVTKAITLLLEKDAKSKKGK